MNIRIDPGWFYTLPVRFRDGVNGAAGEPQTATNRAHETDPVPISSRLAIYRISQSDQDYKIGGTD